MKQKLLLLSVVMAFFLLPIISNAQITVSGTVTDANTKEVLPGVTVRVKGTRVGTVTNANGRYSLGNVNAKAIIEFSFLGYITYEAPAAETVNAALRSDVAKLAEVVVTGLATSVKRSNLANAVATLSAKELTGTAPPQTLEGALNGKLTGANIVSASGAPGGGISVRLRGITSINSNTQPLYVVDGVFMDNSSISAGLNTVTVAGRASSATSNQDNPSNRIADINPEDIQSIEVLKGASAAAIYGALASSGVVIITTKRGAQGRTQVTVSQDMGFNQAIKLLGVGPWNEDKIQTFFQTVSNGVVTNQPDVDAQKTLFRNAVAQGQIFDYEKEMYGQKGLLSNTSLSISGGGEKTKFYVSGLHQYEDGIIQHTGYTKSSFRANVDHRISDRFNITLTSSYIHSSADRGLTNNDNAGVSFGVALASTPTYAQLHPDANGNFPRNQYAASNPLETRDVITNNEKVDRFVGGATFTAYLQESKISTTRLILNGGLDSYTLATRAIFPNTLQFESNGNGTNGASIQGNTTNLNTNLSAYVVNSLSTEDQKLHFTTSGGGALNNFDQNTILNTATILITGQTNLDQASAIRVDQIRTPRRNRGLFLQEEINWNDRVILTGGLRLDKSSDNADVKKFQYFPKASIAINTTSFSFWKSETINQFKLRAAFGESGNFPPFGSKFTSFAPSNIGGVGGVLIGVQNQAGFPQLGDDVIKQERQKELEMGFDLGLWNGRLALEATGYNRTGSNLIFAQNIPSSSGFVQKIINGGTLRNRGLELALIVLPFNNENFTWNSRTNFWLNRSKVTRLDIPSFNFGGFSNGLSQYKIEQGKSATQIVGVDDINGDGVSDGVFVLGNSEPKFQMSFLNEFTILKNLSASFVLHWKAGGQNINLTQLLTDLGGTSPDWIQNAAKRTSLLGVSARQFVQNSHYIRLREVGLYYTLPANVVKRGFNNAVQSVRIGASATNLFTISPYISYDPEVSNFGTGGFSSSVEVTPFPSSKRIFFHLSVNF
ncbi:MAG TPA: SusC/RagA family TonB-linked outer membrane protein [Daejeonella sp.]|nr:SusC/RagA family TonB-linked outer membrane protein [Daejeonella sp.]